jgi:toxin ParE1/3/4
MPAPRLFRTAEAIADLDEIWSYIANDSLVAADRVLDELNEQFHLLLKNPEIGERQSSLADGTYRRITCRNYVIYYRPIVEGVVVVRVLHGARDHQSQLSD